MKNKNEIMKSVSGVVNKTTMTLKKHSPEILVVAGVIGAVASAVTRASMVVAISLMCSSVLLFCAKILLLPELASHVV